MVQKVFGPNSKRSINLSIPQISSTFPVTFHTDAVKLNREMAPDRRQQLRGCVRRIGNDITS